MFPALNGEKTVSIRPAVFRWKRHETVPFSVPVKLYIQIWDEGLRP
jgi:hypothetical protein